MAIVLKRWKLLKSDERTGRRIEILPPEPLRHYWTRTGAGVECDRLNRSCKVTGLPWRYAVARR